MRCTRHTFVVMLLLSILILQMFPVSKRIRTKMMPPSRTAGVTYSTVHMGIKSMMMSVARVWHDKDFFGMGG